METQVALEAPPAVSPSTSKLQRSKHRVNRRSTTGVHSRNVLHRVLYSSLASQRTVGFPRVRGLSEVANGLNLVPAYLG